MIGRTISHYRVISQLGAGGMGVVYGADDTRLGRQVALKFIPEELARDRQAVERFRVEARATSALNHPNICTIYDIGEHEGEPFIVMEWMKGQTLHHRLASGTLKLPHLVEVGIEIADALDAAHSQGIVHRDIKPANIFLTDRGHSKVMDFGLAKLLQSQDMDETASVAPETLTLPGMTLGTASYMSPEQAAGDPIDCRADLFSLGIVLYECATGRKPFIGNSTRAVLAAILNRAPAPPGLFNAELPSRLEEVINHCLEKDRDLRYQNAAGVRADLKRVKRDLESGRTALFATTSDPRHKLDRPSSDHALAPERTPRQTPGNTPLPIEAPSLSTRGPRPRVLGATAVSVALVVVAVGYLQRPNGPPATGATASQAAGSQSAVATTPPAAPSSATLLQSRLELAERSFQSNQFRDAQRYADDVLAMTPGDAKARAIRDQAADRLRRAETSLATARRLIKAGDVRGAVRAMEDARAIDPSSPGLAEVSATLTERFKSQAELEWQRSRTAPSPPTPVQAAPEPPREPVTQPAIVAPPPPAIVAPATPAPEPPPAKVDPPEPAIKPGPSPTAPVGDRKPTTDATRDADDEAAIRDVVATYARAIELKDLSLFRSIKPNLTADEERRIQQGFRAVRSQTVNINILSIDRRGDRAALQLRRQDIIEAGGRRQSPESRQTMTLAKSNGTWTIVEIGR
jgi:serine/threonine protein kinase